MTNISVSGNFNISYVGNLGAMRAVGNIGFTARNSGNTTVEIRSAGVKLPDGTVVPARVAIPELNPPFPGELGPGAAITFVVDADAIVPRLMSLGLSNSVPLTAVVIDADQREFSSVIRFDLTHWQQ